MGTAACTGAVIGPDQTATPTRSAGRRLLHASRVWCPDFPDASSEEDPVQGRLERIPTAIFRRWVKRAEAPVPERGFRLLGRRPPVAPGKATHSISIAR